jgi:hypothetical protein
MRREGPRERVLCAIGAGGEVHASVFDFSREPSALVVPALSLDAPYGGCDIGVAWMLTVGTSLGQFDIMGQSL